MGDIEIDVEHLSPEERMKQWAVIKKDYPSLADHLNDPFVKQLKEQFGAKIIHVSYLNETLPSSSKNPS